MRLFKAALAFVMCLAFLGLSARSGSQEVIKVGVLFSSSGTMAASEKPMLDATMLAIDEINESGISLASEKRIKLQAVIADGASSPAEFAEKATELMEHQGVRIFFGCWTSDSRKAVLKVLEARGGLLYYPVQFEGQEDSPAAIYSGLTANQQLFPALRFLSNEGYPKIFLVGSDYLYPRTTNQLCRRYLAEHGGSIVGERYKKRGSSDFHEIVAEIGRSGCSVVLNTINGDSQRSFLQQYREAGLKMPIMSLSLSETQALAMGSLTDGTFSCAGYFSSLHSPQNARFCAAFQKRYGQQRVLDDASETAYSQVRAFAQALLRCGRAEPAALRQATRALILDTPGGLIRYDPKSLYCWRAIRIARFEKGRAKVVWSSELPIRPEPFLGARP
ncbi:MAG: transporter substrate-binding protein [Candidatus Eremiobacteraeota bacterium]|nr:transporter substrate-binding protein [Candidatus Eremiobacteraeota bacterium]